MLWRTKDPEVKYPNLGVRLREQSPRQTMGTLSLQKVCSCGVFKICTIELELAPAHVSEHLAYSVHRKGLYIIIIKGREGLLSSIAVLGAMVLT